MKASVVTAVRQFRVEKYEAEVTVSIFQCVWGFFKGGGGGGGGGGERERERERER